VLTKRRARFVRGECRPEGVLGGARDRGTRRCVAVAREMSRRRDGTDGGLHQGTGRKDEQAGRAGEGERGERRGGGRREAYRLAGVRMNGQFDYNRLIAPILDAEDIY